MTDQSVETGQNWVPLSPVERAMARRMSDAAATPVAGQWVDVRVDAALALIAELRAQGLPATFNSLTMHAVGMAMRRYPALGARLDYEKWRKLLPTEVKIGVAVAAPRGLLVPAVAVSSTSLAETSSRLHEVVEAIRGGASDRSLFEGACFTVSNIGPIGIHGGFPVPPPGQTAILGVASAHQAAVVVDGALAVGTISSLTIAIDHRAVDGITAAQFLRYLADLIEDPRQLAS